MLFKLRILTAGESHGPGLTGIIEGVPASLEINEEYLKFHLSRRQLGHGRGGRMKIENDEARILSGVRHGKTLASPMALRIENRDWKNWTEKMSTDKIDSDVPKITLPRPGHADLAGIQKYGFDDIRNVLERSSARETAMRVGLASVCRKLLEEVGIYVGSHVTQIYNIIDEEPISESLNLPELNKQADLSPVRCLNKEAETKMVEEINKARKAGDSLGGCFRVYATGLPYGLGSSTHWDRKLNTRISAAMMSINAIKGVEIGAGFESALKTGSNYHDEILYNDDKYSRPTNNAGGIEGGCSNAQPIVIKMVMKPIPTLARPLRSVDIISHEEKAAFKERTDSCSVPAASVIAESMLCLVLADALLEKFGGDSLDQLKAHMKVSARY